LAVWVEELPESSPVAHAADRAAQYRKDSKERLVAFFIAPDPLDQEYECLTE
jgi:hypothetical protein